MLMLSACLISFCAVRAGGEWFAQPLVAHEWGVHVFDWQGNAALTEALPDFMHTDAKPGTSIPVEGRVKDLPPDSGIRTKPVLYFYTPGYNIGGETTPVGVEVRFAAGHASAWWPQVSIYRTPAQVAQAVPIDWPAWQAMHQGRRWNTPLTKVPDDERFELVWHNLALTAAAPNLPPAGGDLPEDHWVRRARQVNSLYVSNGKEAEKFVFYEGKTAETPAIAILPPVDQQDVNYHLVNVSDFPIYDIFAVYRDSERGVVWTKYLAELPPAPARPVRQGSLSGGMSAFPLPDFAALPNKSAPDAATFTAHTSDRLLEVLTAGEYFTGQFTDDFWRDPADFQPPTASAQLFPDEARAVEAIWRNDFFSAEGLTIIYRESPASLDQAMPLLLFTDMFHYVKLSRCGLVLNRHIPISQLKAVDKAVTWSRWDAENREEHLALCRQNRFLALGLARYYALMMPTAGYDYLDPQTKAEVHSGVPWFPRLIELLRVRGERRP